MLRLKMAEAAAWKRLWSYSKQMCSTVSRAKPPARPRLTFGFAMARPARNCASLTSPSLW